MIQSAMACVGCLWYSQSEPAWGSRHEIFASHLELANLMVVLEWSHNLKAASFTGFILIIILIYVLV